MSTIRPGSGTGTITTDFEWRTTSTVVERPFGIRTRSRSMVKTRPVYTRSDSSVSASPMIG